MTTGHVEQLERRSLFSATLTNGTLSITGTAGNDWLVVYPDAGDPRPVNVAESRYRMDATARDYCRGRETRREVYPVPQSSRVTLRTSSIVVTPESTLARPSSRMPGVRVRA